MSVLVCVNPYYPKVPVRRLANPDATAVPWEFRFNADIVDGPSTLLLRWPLSPGKGAAAFFQRRHQPRRGMPFTNAAPSHFVRAIVWLR